MEGEGEVLDVATGERHAIRPGTLYALNLNDQHVLRATKGDLRLVCVFNPPLSGTRRIAPTAATPKPEQDGQRRPSGRRHVLDH